MLDTIGIISEGARVDASACPARRLIRPVVIMASWRQGSGATLCSCSKTTPSSQFSRERERHNRLASVPERFFSNRRALVRINTVTQAQGRTLWYAIGRRTPRCSPILSDINLEWRAVGSAWQMSDEHLIQRSCTDRSSKISPPVITEVVR